MDYTGLVSRFSRYLALGGALAFGSCSKGKTDEETANANTGEKSQTTVVAAPAQPTTARPATDAPTTGGDLGYGDDARLFASPAAAVKALLSEGSDSDKPRVIGFGEYHKLNSSAPVHSALRRFSEEVFDVLGNDAAHLVLETWQVDPACGSDGKEVRKQVEKAIERPPETESEMAMLFRKMRESNTTPHVLQFACDEYKSLLGKEGLDTEKLLTLISKKLEQKTLDALAVAPKNKMVLIYGGATHNNLFPYAGLEHWSFATALAEATDQAYMEIDLYVPELVKDDPLLSHEAWYPLLAQARDDQVILIRRDPASYILILRKAYGAPTEQP